MVVFVFLLGFTLVMRVVLHFYKVQKSSQSFFASASCWVLMVSSFLRKGNKNIEVHACYT